MAIKCTQPVKPMQNGYIERFNCSYRGCLHDGFMWPRICSPDVTFLSLAPFRQPRPGQRREVFH
ncbi:integrase core domain-containing protein [uncultured Pontibacter sp.]|uniref:integrase core domain-containing protein n=1 Tax=uncultured Pontibacter sp. TaxID=453356 RepID=UPI00344D076A